jgi:hypothetical protein
MEQNGTDKLGLSYSPEFIKLTFNGSTFNLWFFAERPILDYINAKTAEANLLGWAMIGK